MSEGEDSKRFVRRRAPVNNLTSLGVKGHGSCILEDSEGTAGVACRLHTSPLV